jgi:hypothetical protein
VYRNAESVRVRPGCMVPGIRPQSIDHETLRAPPRPGDSLARVLPRILSKEIRVSQRAIEIIAGRLVTDEAFRKAFERDPRHTLELLLAQGVVLTETEISALIGTRATLWAEMGEQIDPHLQKADLRSE